MGCFVRLPHDQALLKHHVGAKNSVFATASALVRLLAFKLPEFHTTRSHKDDLSRPYMVNHAAVKSHY